MKLADLTGTFNGVKEDTYPDISRNTNLKEYVSKTVIF